MTSAKQTIRHTPELREPILEDDYPIYAGYLYVADGKVVISDWHDITAREFKAREGVTELRRCDIFGRRDASRATGEGSANQCDDWPSCACGRGRADLCHPEAR